MGRSKQQLPKKLRAHRMVRGRYGCVWLSDEAKAGYDALCARSDKTGISQAATIKRYFERFAEFGPDGLDIPTQLKNQGQVKSGRGKKVRVWAIKAYQWRLYGVHRNYNGTSAFVGLCVDADKKKDKADPALLAKCARLSNEL